jgi:hypothetical protein
MNIDDEIDDNSIFAKKTSTHQKKAIPQWARSKFKMITSKIKYVKNNTILN